MAKQYKVGDKVVVRSDLVDGEFYYMYDVDYDDEFTSEMMDFVGETVTIAGISSVGAYNILEDGGDWHWTDDMFAGYAVTKPEKRDIEVHQLSKVEIYVERVIFQEPATILFYRMPKYDNNTGEFLEWSDTMKMVAKTNVSEGDVFDEATGVNVCILKALRKQVDKELRKI